MYIFDLRSVESTDAEPVDMESRLSLYFTHLSGEMFNMEINTSVDSRMKQILVNRHTCI